MPPAVLPPEILSLGRTTLRSLSPCTQPSAWCETAEAAPSPPVDARLTEPPAPPGQPDLSGAPRLATGPFTVGLPLSPLQPRLCTPPLPCSFEPTSAAHLAQPLDLRVLLHVQSRCTCKTLPPYRCPMLPWAFCSASTVLGDPYSGKGAPPKRAPPRRCKVDQLQRVCCVASVVSGATRGRRDAGHRAPRSVAGRRRGPEGKGSELQRPSEERTGAHHHPSKDPLRASWGAVRTEVQDTTARGATSQSEDPPGLRGEPQEGSHRRFVQPQHEAAGEEPPGAQSMILTSKNAVGSASW